MTMVTGIARAELYVVTQRSRVDTVTARGSRTASPEVFLRLTDVDGASGWGAAAPKWYLTGESQDGVVAVLRERVLPWLLHQRDLSLESLSARLDRTVRHNWAAKTAVDVALHDLLGQRLGVPVYELLGGQRADLDLSGFEVLFLGASRQAAVDQARAALEQGYRNLKIKAGADVVDALARASAVRQELGWQFHVTVDANQAWDTESTLRAAAAMTDAGIDEVEQPVLADALDDLRRLSEALPVPVTVDESACSTREVEEIIRLGAGHGVVLKVAKSGGIGPSRAMARVCAEAGIYCVAGATLQNAVLEAATAHLFLATPNIARHEVKLLVSDDVAEGPRIVNGGLAVPDEPGLGVRVDESRLNPVAVAVPQ